tara:strand:+ start:239 stop:1036 length:798 start_codon:yes stop_codon:yes gene_type:complete
MKITIFTSNQTRHNYLINILSSISDECFVVQENKTIFPGLIPGNYSATEAIKRYFDYVLTAQKKIFGNTYIDGSSKNIKLLSLANEDLNRCSIDFLSDFLKSDVYIVFGSSYIKGDLVNFLIKNKAINIHMGISPYYRGSDCNFWALYDGNIHLAGSTVHLLSKGLDSGPILYHAISEKIADPFLYTMSTVKSAFVSLKNKLEDNSIFNIKPINQDLSKQIRYSKSSEFTDEVIHSYFKKKIDLGNSDELEMLKDPFVLKKVDYI